MKANETTLIELIGVRKRVFSIPVYQRNYDWKTDNCKQLFYDIQLIVETGRDHFLGTIVYIPDRSTATCPVFIIIDGQQRITSVMLFIKALHDSMDDEDIREDIEQDYLRNSKGASEYRLKLKPIESDQNVYEKLMMMNDFNEDLFTIPEKQTAIYRNYDLFKQLIFDSDYSAKELYEAVFKLEIVEIQLDKENPQEIFESLNSTGLDLSNADLLRNYLLMSLDYDKQQIVYKQYWLQIEKMLGNEYIESFMTYYLILKRKSDSVNIDGKRAHITSLNIYRCYKMYYSDEVREENNLIALLSDMKKYASIYQHFVNNEEETGVIADLHREIFTQFNSPALAVPLMYFYNLMNEKKIFEKDYIDCLKAFVSYLFRSRIAGHNVGPQFCGLVIQYFERSERSSFIEKVWEALNSGKGSYSFPSDEEFKGALQTKDLYLSLRSAGVRYLLYKIESFLTKEVVTIENATIEHILPQTISNEWRNYLLEKKDNSYDICIHRLGNLTLTKENSKLSNNMFKDKLSEYEESNYTITRQLTKFKEWTSKEIKARSISLSELAIQIWPLPEEYNKIKEENKAKTGLILSLDDDLESIIGTRPISIMVYDDVISVNNWTEAYLAVHNKLCGMSSEAYFSYLNSEDNVKENIISSEKDGFKQAVKLADNLYLNTSFRNVKRMMRKLQLFIEYYIEKNEEECGDLMENILIEA